MRRLFSQHALMILPSLAVAVLVVLASQQTAHGFEPPISLQTLDTKYIYESHPCPGWNQQVSVSGEGVIQACVSGDRYKLARYYPSQGGVAYAIQFPGDALYYGLDVCGVAGCVLSGDGKTFAGFEWNGTVNYRAQIYKDFVGNLIQYTPSSGAGKRYRVGKPPDLTTAHPNGTSLFAAALAVSASGEWVAIEIKTYGTVLVNVESLDVRRIHAPGVTYGVASDPSVEMAVANDGRSVAFMGMRAGIRVIRVDSTCGDRFNLTTIKNFQGAITPCSLVGLNTAQIMNDFQWAGHPEFDRNSVSLSFVAHDRFGVVRQVIARSSVLTSTPGIELVAIGDSFTSGEGEIEDSYYIGTAANACHVSTRSYIYLVGSAWGSSTLNAACSGATIKDTIHDGDKGEAQLDRISKLRPKVVIIGIGGNDAGLMGKLSNCVAPGTCEWAESSEARTRTAEEVRALYPKLRSLYSRVRVTAGAEILVAGYPNIISTVATCNGLVGVLLDETERKFMHEALKYLNAVVKQAATDSGLRFVDLSESFGSNKLCDPTDTPAMNGIRLGDDISVINALPRAKSIGAESFHPTPFGHVLNADQFVLQFPNVHSVTSCDSCVFSGKPPEPAAYWGQNVNTLSLSQRYNRFAYQKNEPATYELRLPEGSFAASSEVVIEVHSDPIKISTVTTAPDGSLQIEVGLPSFLEPGSHSIHATGVSSTGKGIKYYDFVQVVSEDGVATPLNEDLVSPDLMASAREVKFTSHEIIADSGEQEVLGVSRRSKAEGLANKNVMNVSTQSNNWPQLALLLTLIFLSNLTIIVYYRKKMSRYSSG